MSPESHQQKTYFEDLREEVKSFPLPSPLDKQSLLRIKQIVLKNKEIIQGKKVLDLGAGHGLFSLAMHGLGADQVLAMDVREEHRNNFLAQTYLQKIPAQKLHFICGDFAKADQVVQPGDFDTLLFAGTFYHISNHVDMLQMFHRMKFSHLILDTVVTGEIEASPSLEFFLEDTDFIWNGVAEGKEQILAATPTRSLLRMMLSYTGWSLVRSFDYSNFIVDGNSPSLRKGQHVTYTCVRREI